MNGGLYAMIARTQHRRWTTLWVCFLVALFARNMAMGQIIHLEAWVTYGVLDAPAGNYLADGSVFYVIGSSDAVNDGMQPWGTNYIANSVQGNDVFIGSFVINSADYGPGSFYIATEFDAAQVSYLYIRVFNTTTQPVEGLVNWGTSDMVDATGYNPVLFDLYVDFAPSASIITTNYDNFVVIPEPGTGSMALLFLGLAWGLRATTKRSRKQNGKTDEPDVHLETY